MNLGVMVLLEVKCSGAKLVPRLDLQVRSASRRITSKEISFNIGTGNVRRLRQAGRLENLTLKMDKCKLSAAGLSEVRWPREGEIVSGNYSVFYSD
jgi:hypothetical protein